MASDPSSVREVGNRMSRAAALRILVPTWVPSYMLKLRCLSTSTCGEPSNWVQWGLEPPTSWQKGRHGRQSSPHDRASTSAPNAEGTQPAARAQRDPPAQRYTPAQRYAPAQRYGGRDRQDPRAHRLRQLGARRPPAQGERARGAARALPQLAARGW